MTEVFLVWWGYMKPFADETLEGRNLSMPLQDGIERQLKNYLLN